VHAAAELALYHRQRTLLLGHDHTGASELSDIAWARGELSTAEQSAALHALVGVALQTLAAQRRHYAMRLVAELPGVRDAAGQSPFWQGLGRHFYGGDPAAAHAQHGPAWRSHVAALLPRQVIYTSFLPEAAQAAIAQCDAPTLLLREVLEDAGLRYSHHVNVEDGGAILEAAIDDLPAVQRSMRA
jgi:arginine N-succinyltransferase